MAKVLEAQQAEAAGKEDPAPFLRAVGRQVRWLRFERELTQDDLAAAAGMSRSFVSLIEQGGHGMNLVRLFGLAQALGCEPWELLRDAAQRAAGSANQS